MTLRSPANRDMAIEASKKSTERSGTRVQCEIDAVLRSADETCSFCAPCRIVLVNLNGCALTIYRAVDVGSVVLLLGLASASKVTGRVVTSISLGQHGKAYWLLGVAIDEPGNVWGISNPPADWVERSAEGVPQNARICGEAAAQVRKESNRGFALSAKKG
jgi:hypothetical protein